MLQNRYKVVQTERLFMVLWRIKLGIFQEKKVGKNNGDNRETVNPSFILAHPLVHEQLNSFIVLEEIFH